jgi:TolA-binding protein
MIRFHCRCGRKLKTDRGHAGREFPCPACGAKLRVPAPAADSAGAPKGARAAPRRTAPERQGRGPARPAPAAGPSLLREAWRPGRGLPGNLLGLLGALWRRQPLYLIGPAVLIFLIAPLTLAWGVAYWLDVNAFATAQRRGTPNAYRHYLGRYPDGARVEEANAALEAAIFEQAEDRDRESSYRYYLKLYPEGRYADEAQRRACRAAYRGAREEDTPAAYRRFIEAYPRSDRAVAARKARQDLEAPFFRRRREENTAEGYRSYLAEYPEGRFRLEARRSLEALAYEEAAQAGTSAAWRRFLEAYPHSSREDAAREALREARFGEVCSENTVAAYREYLHDHPDGDFVDAARDRLAVAAFAEISAALREGDSDRAAALLTAARRLAPQRLAEATVLLVDDDEELVRALRREGFLVLEAEYRLDRPLRRLRIREEDKTRGEETRYAGVVASGELSVGYEAYSLYTAIVDLHAELQTLSGQTLLPLEVRGMAFPPDELLVRTETFGDRVIRRELTPTQQDLVEEARIDARRTLGQTLREKLAEDPRLSGAARR